MFNVYLDGVYDSTHQTFTSACRYARQQAVKHQQSYYTVFEAGDEGEEMMLLDGERATLQGVPDYIIAPHVVTMQTDTGRKAGLARLASLIAASGKPIRGH